MCEFQGKYRIGEIKEKQCLFAFCLNSETQREADFSITFDPPKYGAQFFCQVAYSHFAKQSIIKERLPKVIENTKQLGIKQLICMHDGCYGAFTPLAPAFGMEVTFESIHHLEYLSERLQELKSEIKPLNIKGSLEGNLRYV